MSKKDKRKKQEGGRGTASSWIADLRRGAAGLPSEAPPSAEPVAEAEATEPAEPAEPDEQAALSDEGEMPVIPRLRPLDEASLGGVRSSSGDDLGEETLADIAPIGPTEYAGASLGAEGAPENEGAEKAPGTTSVEHLEQQIKDLEARLDEMIGQRREGYPSAPPVSLSADDDALPGVTAGREPIPRAIAAADAVAAPASGATAKEVLSSDFYLRQWGRAGMRKRFEEVDEFGLDPTYEARYLPLLDFLYKHYFRVEAQGTANIPEQGRCLLVSNHSGGPLPYDGLMLRTTVRREHPSARELRWLAEDFIYYLPFAGAMMNRLGAVRACQENAERLLAGGKLLAVFPEGAKGIGKLYKDRYKLQRFGRGGFVRLALRTQTPIVPSAIVGAEEANPMLYRIEYMTKALGIPYLPITPTFPALGPLGLLPAPTKWKVVFGEPIHFDGYGPEAADDEILVGRLAERVRATIQGMLESTLATRRSIWFG
jgi:1-acyl-sn-glycerol-3-phosphate acyltransferase